MPSLNKYKKKFSNLTDGKAVKNEADLGTEYTWNTDVASRVGYLYDWYRDKHKTQLDNMLPETDDLKIPIDIKYFINEYQSLSKDAVAYHIQLRPSQECNVPYYEEYFAIKYGAHFPIGLYIDIPDSKGIYNRWLVVGEANYNDAQFPTYKVLRCDYVVNAIIEGVKYYFPVVLRSQNSYNSGVWQDKHFRIVEDQQKFIVPLNRLTEKLVYDKRLLVDNYVLTEPRAWKISKINRLSVAGLANITLAQDMYNDKIDYVEVDEDNNVVGLWADYYESKIVPKEDEDEPSVYGKILYSGLNPILKVGGNYKKFSVVFYDGDEEIEYRDGEWKFFIGDEDASSLVMTLDSSQSSDVDENQIKVKFIGDDSYIGEKIKIVFESDIETEVEIEIKGL